jgi:hypothetical protein
MVLMVGSSSLPDPAREVDRCERGSPRHPLPRSADTNEGEHGAVCTSALAGYQFNTRVRNDYPPVIAKSRNGELPAARSAALHCPIKAPPMHGPKRGRDDNIEISAERIVRRMTHNLGDCITPLMDDAVAVDGHGGALIITSRLGSVHTLITVRARTEFTGG